MRRRTIGITLALTALTGVAAAPAPAATKKAPSPKISKVSPMRLSVGSKFTIRGRNFSSKRRRNTVIFRAPNGRSAFAKPRKASSRKLIVRVPASVARLVRGKRTVRFKLRVLSRKRFSRWTRKRLSPIVLGSLAPGAGGGGAAAACPGTDFDGDLLPASLENTIGTDICLKDTDGDGAEDGFEYRSAVDLNNDNYQNPNLSLPYPGKRPYPNPLDPSDGVVDYDGDGLNQRVEQKLWHYSDAAPRTLSPLTYSDGLQYSVYKTVAGQGDRRYPALAAAGYAKASNFISWAVSSGYRNPWIETHNEYGLATGPYGLFDFNLNGSESASEGLHYDVNPTDGWLSDDERDEDADGLRNFDETRGRMMPGWFDSCYSMEVKYYVAFGGTDPTDADADNDGVRDGADDQDHDGVPNVMELSRKAAWNQFALAYPGIEGDGNDIEPGYFGCKVDKLVDEATSSQDPPIYWHEEAYGRVNPYNPCLPFILGRTCNRHPTFGASWAPFDNSPNWFVLN